MVAGFLTASDRSALRYHGYQDAMAAAGLATLPLAEVGFDAHALDTQLQQWLHRMPDWPTAIFCSTDMLALGVIKVLRGLDLSIPRDISVIGFDGLAFGRLIEPTLATISQPNEQIGRLAAQRLLARIEGAPIEPPSLFLPHTLLTGRSVDLPRTNGASQ
jgi:DNA-binding LacI/PurR family transcriptional regulator